MMTNDQALIRCTAAALRDSCDRILNDGAALSLPATVLRVLDANFAALFPEARAEFAPAAGSSLVATEALRDLQFLHDLAQLVSSLLVTADSDSATSAAPAGAAAAAAAAADDGDNPVPLASFSRLERLELTSVPVSCVRGLQARRPYLRVLACTGGVSALAELLAGCGGDRSSPFLWEVLSELRVTRCGLAAVGRDTLRLAPHLTALDLSHNRLAAADGLDCLAGLQRLNLAGNMLSALPHLSMPALLTIRWLSLRGNRLEAIGGVEEMVALEHLDVGYNFLLSHAVLRPLAVLSRLGSLQLSGNPLCSYRDHRCRAAEHLHHCCLAGQLVLDGRRLRRSEAPQWRDPPAVRRVDSAPPSPAAPTARQRLSRPPSQPGRRPRTAAAAAASSASGSVERGSGGSTPRLQRRRSKRRSRVNMADISDMDSAASLTGAATSSSLNEVAEGTADEPKELPSHLVTREMIESLRLQMGADWLHSRGGARVQQLLGLPEQPPPTFTVGSLPIDGSASRAMGDSRGATPPYRGTPPGADQPPPPPPATATAANTAGAAPGDQPAEPSLYPSRDPDLSWEPESSEEEEDEDDVRCLVVARRLMRRAGLEEDVMLTITSAAVKEKELDAGRVVAEWDIRSVEACHVTKMEPLTVQLNFDTVRKEKRERNYIMEQSEWEELSAVLLPIIEERLAAELAANALQCIKCSAEFYDAMARTTAAHEDVRAGRTRHVQTCPNCSSNMIIRAEKVSHPNAEVARSPGALAKTAAKKYPLKKRLSGKKIVASTPRHMLERRTEANFLASTPIADEVAVEVEREPTSETSSTTAKAEVHTDSSVSVVTSEPEPEPMVSEQNGRSMAGDSTSETTESRVKSDSDVEVISNPSESSIDVIMDSMTRSEADVEIRPTTEGRETTGRRESTVLSAVANTSAAAAGGPPMEESSSSGSMTTSVCTVRDRRERLAAAPPPPPANSLAPEAADLSCTLTPESGCSDALNGSAISPLNGSAISPLNSSAISPCDSSATSRVDGGAAARMSESQCDSVLDSWLREIGEADSVEEAGTGRLRFWHDDLTRLDHRLQLYLDMNVLEPTEQVAFIAKCTCALEPHYRELACVLVVSTSNLYILEITGEDSGQLERWLRARLTRPVTEVSAVGALLHCHGLGVQLVGRDPALNTQLLLITRHAGRGRLLLTHFNEVCAQAAHTDRWLRTQRLQVEHMLSGDAGADLELRQLLFVDLVTDNPGAAVPVMLCMTASDLLLMECDLRWLVPGHGDVKIPMRDREKVANIVGLELLRCAADAGGPGLQLLFQDDSSGAEHSWRLGAVSRATLADLVSALQQPWAGAVSARLQAPCDLYRTAQGDLLRLARLGPLLTGSWLKVTAVAESRPDPPP